MVNVRQVYFLEDTKEQVIKDFNNKYKYDDIKEEKVIDTSACFTILTFVNVTIK